MKRFTKIMAIIMATALLMSIAAISASAEDYASTATISAANGKGGTAYSDPVTGSNVSANVKTGFTNDRTGIIPTGVLPTIAPFAIGILLFGAVIIFFIAKRRRNNA